MKNEQTARRTVAMLIMPPAERDAATATWIEAHNAAELARRTLYADEVWS